MEARYVPIEDVAKYFAVSISTIRVWVRQNIIPKSTYFKVGGTSGVYRFNLKLVEEALTGQVQEAVETDDVEDGAPVQLELDFGTNLDDDN